MDWGQFMNGVSCMREFMKSFGGSILLDIVSKKIHLCKTHQNDLDSEEYWPVRDWVDYMGSSPEEINKGLNQSNRNEKEEMMVFRKIEVFKTVRNGN